MPSVCITSSIKRCLSLGFATLLSTNLMAAQPLSEEAMGDFALDSGLNLLNIYGPTSAGLEDDLDTPPVNVELKSERQEASLETVKSTVDEIIEDNELALNGDNNAILAAAEQNLSFAEIENAIQEGVSTIGSAVFNDSETISEIRFRNNAFIRDANPIDSNTVIQTRELVIDRLVLENLRGDHNDNRVVGDIYLSDWISRGSTQISSER